MWQGSDSVPSGQLNGTQRGQELVESRGILRAFTRRSRNAGDKALLGSQPRGMSQAKPFPARFTPCVGNITYSLTYT